MLDKEVSRFAMFCINDARYSICYISGRIYLGEFLLPLLSMSPYPIKQNVGKKFGDMSILIFFGGQWVAQLLCRNCI
jgi:hypothetical protein